MIFGIYYLEQFEIPFSDPLRVPPGEKKMTGLKDNTLKNIIMCKLFYYICFTK